MQSVKGRLIAVALLGAAAFFVWRIPPEENAAIPRCPVLSMTGFYCAGCGSLRSMHSLLHGDLARAWSMNPLTVMLMPLLAVLAVDDLILNRTRAAQRIRPRFIWLLLALFIVFAIVRNLPVYPFTSLAPH